MLTTSSVQLWFSSSLGTMSSSDKREVSWPKVLYVIHVFLLSVFALGVITDSSLLTLFFSALLMLLGVIGQTAGAHRLWAHQSYQANWGLRVFLMLCQTLAAQGSIHDWVVRHRAHHKYAQTDRDPCQAHKSFWKAHIVAQVMQPSQADQQAYKEIDTQDLENDAVVAFQRKFYWLLMPIIAGLLPINAPMEYWGESVVYSFFIAGAFRYAITCQMSWLIYSAQHIWGLQPNDKYPADTMLVFILTKSHWLRYHYILPWDYQVGEFGGYGDDFISGLIRAFAAFGFANNLRSVSSDTIKEAVYNSTVTGKSVADCVQDITKTTETRSTSQGQFHSAKFL